MAEVNPSVLLSQVSASQADEGPASELAAYLSTHPSLVLILLQPLITRLNDKTNTLPRLKLWILDHALRPALAMSIIPIDQKTQLSTLALDAMSNLLNDPDVAIKKATVQCFASAYPYLFREACVKHNQQQWEKVSALKNTILNAWTSSTPGVRVAATKAVQKIIQTQTRGNADPRMQHRVEPNLAMCPSSHPFMNAQQLEDEAKRLVEECGKQIYISTSPDLMSAIVNIYTGLIKSRPALSNTIFTSMVNWDPSTLVNSSTCTPLQIRSVEKTFRIALAHLLRAGHATAFTGPITEFLHKQNTRMLVAVEEARRKKEEEATRKRNRITDELNLTSIGEPEGKKRRLDIPSSAMAGLKMNGMATGSMTASRNFASASARAGNNEPNPLASFDVTTLPVALVTELIIANLQVVTEAALATSISDIRRELPALVPVKKEVRQGPVNPIGDDDDELEINPVEEEEEIIDAADRELDVFELAVAEDIPPLVSKQLLISAVARICAAPSEQQQALQSPLWLSLVSRLITKGLAGVEAEQDAVREALFEIIKEDVGARLPIAQTWLNEEWMSRPTEASNADSPYALGVSRILDTLLSPDIKHGEAQSRQVSQFILDLPLLPSSEIIRLHGLCQSPDHLQMAFTTLRDIVLYKLQNRTAALDALLSLATHTEKLTRNAAIVTLKRWVPETEPMAAVITTFAISLLDRLDTTLNDDMAIDEDQVKDEAEQAQKPKCAEVQDGQVVSGLEHPSTEIVVTQHIELLFALSVKSPELLDRLFDTYSRMQKETQTHIQKLITMLIRSMGAKNQKILDLVRAAPPGAEDLVLRVIAILTDKGKTAPPLVQLIKEMAAERELNPRYMVAVISELDKPEIIKMLPRILSIVDKSPADKALVRSVIENVVSQPQTFGTVSTNLPRVKQTELLTPVEFFLLLHHNTKEIPLDPAKELISMCLGMQEIFRPEILAAFMQQVIDEPVLPTLFLRTVIQAATMYKSLQPYVSTNLLSRLITKKVWKNPALWEGFIRIARITVPHSFPTLLQLPKEQLREVVQKHPNMLQPLQEHVVQKFGSNKARMASLLETLGVQQADMGSASPMSELMQ